MGHSLRSHQITQWKDQLLDGATGIFRDDAKTGPAAPTVDVKILHAEIGRLTLENDSLSGALGKAGLLKEMINREYCPSCARQSFSASAVATSIIRRVLCQTAIRL